MIYEEVSMNDLKQAILKYGEELAKKKWKESGTHSWIYEIEFNAEKEGFTAAVNLLWECVEAASNCCCIMDSEKALENLLDKVSDEHE